MSNGLRLLLTAAVLTAALSACAPFPRLENDAGFWEIQLEDGELTLQWKVEADLLHLIVSAPTTGFVGVGFDPTAIMRDADILIGWVDDDDLEVHVRDDYGDTTVTHRPDVDDGGTSDVTVVSGTQSAGRTTLDYTIPLSSGDSHDRVLTPGQTHRFMLSYGATDDITVKHIERHAIDVVL